MEILDPVSFFMNNFIDKNESFAENLLRELTPFVFFNQTQKKELARQLLLKAGLAENYVHFSKILEMFAPQEDHPRYEEIIDTFNLKILQICQNIKQSNQSEADLRFDIKVSLKKLLPLLVEEANKNLLSQKVLNDFQAYLEYPKTRFKLPQNKNLETWQNFGAAEIVAKFEKKADKKTYTFVCNTIQMSILAIFNYDRSTSFGYMRKIFNVDENTLKSALIIFVGRKILRVSPKNNNFGKF